MEVQTMYWHVFLYKGFPHQTGVYLVGVEGTPVSAYLTGYSCL